MPFKPFMSVTETLNHLSTRLDPIIADWLAPQLKGIPWTRVLEILDEKKGTTHSIRYSSRDLQAQLKMLTSRLGDLEYPFDNRHRLVSTTASKLRILRNRNAHNEDLTVYDAFRASDSAVELLRYFGDDEGLVEAKRLRHEALIALAQHAGVSEAQAEQSAALAPPPEDNDPTSDEEDDLEEVVPDAEVMEKDASSADDQILGLKRLEYEPWDVVAVGDKDVLRDLRNKSSQQQVRTVTAEIVSHEGPIHVDRLTRLTARSFNVRRLTKKREQSITRQIRRAGFYIDEDSFVWPREIDANSWSEFRPNDNSARRYFAYISPIEIVNAARFIKAKHPEISADDLEGAVLRTFGKKRRTKMVQEHLRKVYELL